VQTVQTYTGWAAQQAAWLTQLHDTAGRPKKATITFIGQLVLALVPAKNPAKRPSKRFTTKHQKRESTAGVERDGGSEERSRADPT
jgi:hypothetical protein